jgi:phosphatidylserine decarboxylase
MIYRGGHYEPIAREGLVFIAPPAILSAACWWCGYSWASLVFLLVSIAIALFFRNPERTPPEGDGIVLSPADGRVVEIVEHERSERLPEISLKRISIFMSIFNTHVNRWPISGKVVKITYVPGRFLDAREPAASAVNEHNCLVVNGESLIEVVQIAGKIARRIACWVREGDEVRRGDRFGLIRFGSRLDVYLPQDYSFVVEVGTRVRAGVTIIAQNSATNRCSAPCR